MPQTTGEAAALQRRNHGCLLADVHTLCRGIDVVRNKIKMFAQKKVTLPPGRHKIVILDEADRQAPVVLGTRQAPAQAGLPACEVCFSWLPVTGH